MGRQAEAALRLFIDDVNQSGGIRVGGTPREVALECLDDASDPGACEGIYRSLCYENRADLVLGPYSSRLTRAAAPIAERAGMVILNHGGAHDELYEQGYRMIVGVLSPAGEYMAGFVRMLAGLKLWSKRLAIVTGEGRFGRAVTEGVERACADSYARRKRVRVRVKYTGPFDAAPSRLFPALRRNRVNALISAGNYDHDVAVIRAVVASNLNIPVLGCVAAGVSAFGKDLGGDAEGIVGPSQWEEGVAIIPEIGPAPEEFVRRMRHFTREDGCDYPAAQAYAAALLGKAAIEAAGTLEQRKLREVLSDLRTTTFFGDFSIDRVTGRQLGHRMLLVQWYGGRKIVIQPEPVAESGALEFPSGWRLILTSLQMFRLSRRKREEDDDEGDDESR